MDAGNKRATITIPNSYRVSDITDKMYSLNKETTWGEKNNLSKEDYESIFRMYLGLKKS